MTTQLLQGRHLPFVAFLCKAELAHVLLKLESVQDWETAFRRRVRQLGLQRYHSNSCKSTGLRDVLPPGSKHLRAFPPQLALPYHEEKGDHMLKCRTVCCPFTCIKSIMPLILGWCSMAFLKAHYNQWIGHNRYRTKTSTKKLTWKKNKLHWLDHFQTGLHNSFTSPAFSVCCRGVDTKQHCSDIQDL